MYSETIRTLMRDSPFVPFTVHRSDGKSFHIPHVDFAMLTPTGQTLYVAAQGEPVERINVAQITRVTSESAVEISR